MSRSLNFEEIKKTNEKGQLEFAKTRMVSCWHSAFHSREAKDVSHERFRTIKTCKALKIYSNAKIVNYN
jgi:hypothetical protein